MIRSGRTDEDELGRARTCTLGQSLSSKGAATSRNLRADGHAQRATRKLKNKNEFALQLQLVSKRKEQRKCVKERLPAAAATRLRAGGRGRELEILR